VDALAPEDGLVLAAGQRLTFAAASRKINMIRVGVVKHARSENGEIIATFSKHDPCLIQQAGNAFAALR
jgi:hypothetical protein